MKDVKSIFNYSEKNDSLESTILNKIKLNDHIIQKIYYYYWQQIDV